MGKTNSSISNSERDDLKRLFKNIFLFIPVLLVVASVNVYFDPAGLYKIHTDKYEMNEYRIAQELVSGVKETVVASLNDRLLQKFIIEQMTISPDIVVFGSSHSSWIGRNVFLNKSVMNHSVTNPVLADFLGIYEGYAKKNFHPSNVFLLMDPQLIGFPVVSEKWLSIKEDTVAMLGRLGIDSQKIKQPLIPKVWLNIVSFSYFQQSLRVLSRTYDDQGNSLKKDISDYQLFFNDGRNFWIEEHRLEESESKKIRKFDYGRNGEILKAIKPDKELESILEAFIRYLLSRHIHVTLLLLPLSPELYESLHNPERTSKIFDITDFERYYYFLSQKMNLEIIGSYDPASCNLNPNDFYDQDHIRNDVIEKLLKQNNSKCAMHEL